MATKNKFKKMLALLLAFALVFGTIPITAVASPMEVTFVSGQSGVPLGGYFVDFAEGHFPFTYEATEGQMNLVFFQQVTVTSPAALTFQIDTPTELPTEPSDNNVALVWYQDGTRRTDKGTITIPSYIIATHAQDTPPVRVQLAFDEVSLADMGVWTLRAYSYGQWVESEYALFLQVGEFVPPVGIMPIAAPGSFTTIDISDLPGQTLTSATILSHITPLFDTYERVYLTGTESRAFAANADRVDFWRPAAEPPTIPAGRTLVWQADFTQSNPAFNGGVVIVEGIDGTFELAGGSIINQGTGTGSLAITVTGARSHLVISGGTFQGGANAPYAISGSGQFTITGGTFPANAIRILGDATLLVAGNPTIPPGAIIRRLGTGTTGQNPQAFYIGAHNSAAFATVIVSVMEGFTRGENLHRLDRPMVLDAPGGAIAHLPALLELPATATVTATSTGDTPQPINRTDNTITFLGGSPTDTATITVSGATLANGRITVPTFTTPAFPLTLTLDDWDAVQAALSNPLVTTVNLAGLTTPSDVRTLIAPANRTVTILGGGTQFDNVAFIFGDNANVTINNLNIQSAHNHNSTAPAAQQGRAPLRFLGGTNTLTIEGTNTIRSGQTTTNNEFGPAVNILAGSTATDVSLTISGTGTLYAHAGGIAAAIGTGNQILAGTITIQSGTINAFGSGGAGIGTIAASSLTGTINIQGGTVNAFGDTLSPGIGAGNVTGNINISGGTVVATGGSGLHPGPGIGSGGTGSVTGTSNAGAVTISGNANVTANRGGAGGANPAMAIGHGAVTATGTVHPGTLTIGTGNPTINTNAAIPATTTLVTDPTPDPLEFAAGTAGQSISITTNVANTPTVQWRHIPPSGTATDVGDGTTTLNLSALNLTAGVHEFYAIVTFANIEGFTQETEVTTVTVTLPPQVAPEPPEMASHTATSITLSHAITTGIEFRLGSGNWQDSPTFSGLSPYTDYTFYARLTATATHDVSPPSLHLPHKSIKNINSIKQSN